MTTETQILAAGAAAGAAYLLFGYQRAKVTPGTRDPEVQAILNAAPLRPCGGEDELRGVHMTERGAADSFISLYNAHNSSTRRFGQERAIYRTSSGACVRDPVKAISTPPPPCLRRVVDAWLAVRTRVLESASAFSTSWETRNLAEAEALFGELRALRRVLELVPDQADLTQHLALWESLECGINAEVWYVLKRLSIVLDAAARKHGDPRDEALSQLREDLSPGSILAKVSGAAARIGGDALGALVASPTFAIAAVGGLAYLAWKKGALG